MATTQAIGFTRTTLQDGAKALNYGPIHIVKHSRYVGGYLVRHTASFRLVHRGHWFDKQADAKAYAVGLLAIPGAMEYMDAVQADGTTSPFPNENEVKASMDAYSRTNRPL